MKILLETLAEIFSFIAVICGLALAVVSVAIFGVEDVLLIAITSFILYIGCTISLKLLKRSNNDLNEIDNEQRND